MHQFSEIIEHLNDGIAIVTNLFEIDQDYAELKEKDVLFSNRQFFNFT